MNRASRFLLAAAVLLSGCASGNPYEPKDRDGFMGVLLPRPFGSVSMERSPIACTTGWVGIVTFGLIGGAIGSGAASYGESPPHPEAGAVAGALMGGLVGGLLFTPVGHFLQWVWDLIAGEGAEEEFPGYPP